MTFRRVALPPALVRHRRPCFTAGGFFVGECACVPTQQELRRLWSGRINGVPLWRTLSGTASAVHRSSDTTPSFSFSLYPCWGSTVSSFRRFLRLLLNRLTSFCCFVVASFSSHSWSPCRPPCLVEGSRHDPSWSLAHLVRSRQGLQLHLPPSPIPPSAPSISFVQTLRFDRFRGEPAPAQLWGANRFGVDPGSPRLFRTAFAIQFGTFFSRLHAFLRRTLLSRIPLRHSGWC